MPGSRTAEPVSLLEAGASLSELWSPRILLEVNDHLLKVARVQGEFPWHTHEDEDELFLVLAGELTIGRADADGGPVIVSEGQSVVVPKGVRHNTSAQRETVVALFEPRGTQHAGGESTPLARSLAEQARPL